MIWLKIWDETSFKTLRSFWNLRQDGFTWLLMLKEKEIAVDFTVQCSKKARHLEMYYHISIFIYLNKAFF